MILEHKRRVVQARLLLINLLPFECAQICPTKIAKTVEQTSKLRGPGIDWAKDETKALMFSFAIFAVFA